MKIAYLRVSTKEQNCDSQRIEILKFHPDVEQWVEETMSGVSQKPELNALIEKRLRPGDHLVVYSLNRISRNQSELLALLKNLEEKNITVSSIQERFDFSSASGKLILGILSSLAAFERENLLERQKAGIEAAKLRGAYTGRVWIVLENPVYFEECYQRYRNLKSYKLKNFMESVGMKETTLLKFLKLREELGEPFPNRKDVTIKLVQNLIKEKNLVKEKIY